MVSHFQLDVPAYSRNIFHYSNEVVPSIMEANRYVDEHFDQFLVSSELVRDFHLSRSYFSICLGKIVEVLFNEYLCMFQRSPSLILAKNY